MKRNFKSGEGIATGAATATPVLLTGIKANDVLLAVWTHASGAEPVGRAVSAFTVSDGAIESASVSTANLKVYAIWAVA